MRFSGAPGAMCSLLVSLGSLVVDKPVPACSDEKAKSGPGEAKAKAYRAQFEKAGRVGLVELTKDKDTSLALQASWEIHKKLTPPNVARYDRDELKNFLDFLIDRTKASVPEWWTKELLDLRVKKGEYHFVFSDEKQPTFKEIKVGERTWRARASVTLAQRDGALTLKVGDEVFEYPKDKNDLFRDSFADVRAEKVTCLAAYMSSGGYSFKVSGFENKSGKHLWTTTVWAVERDMLIGPGLGHRVEMTTKGNTVFVFGAERWGMYAEAFDLATGTCQFRFCTSYWGNFSEKWDLK